jgi:hypothetical protein
MAEYCSPEDVLERVGAIELDVNGQDEQIEQQLETAILQVGIEVDVFLQTRADPVLVREDPPPFIRQLVSDLAAEAAIRNSGATPSESVAMRADTARLRLKAISEGTLMIQLPRPTTLKKAFKNPRFIKQNG